VRLLAAFWLLTPPLVASAEQWTLADSFLPADFAPGWATPPNANGFWALGTSDGMAALVRYNADGSVRFLRYPNMPHFQYGGTYQLTTTPDGGVASADVEDTNVLGYDACKMRRYDADGNLLWTSDLAQPTGPYGGGYCSNVAVDGTGGMWLFPAGLNAVYAILVNPDGRQAAQIEGPGLSANRITADPIQAAAYIAGATQIDSTTTLATIWKMTAQGVKWSISAPGTDTNSMLDDVAVAADSSLWAFGHKNTQLFGMHVAANGSLLWSGAFNTTVSPTHVRVIMRADVGVSTLHWDRTLFDGSQASSAPELSRFSNAGTRLWHVSAASALPTSQTQLYQLSVAAVPNGDVIGAWTEYGGGQPDANYYLQQTRIDGNGNSLFNALAQTVPTKNGAQILSLPDYTSLTVTDAFQHRARNGGVLAAPATSAITTSTSYDDNEIMAPDGSSYLLTQNPDSKRYGLSAYLPSGAPRWHASVASNWNNDGLVGSQMLLRSNDICVAGFLDGDEMMQCFALADGHAFPKIVLASSLSSSGTRTQASVTSTDQIVLLYRASDGAMHHALFDVGGNLLHDVTPLLSGETWSASAQNANGDTFIISSSSSLLKLDSNGSRVYSTPTDLVFGGIAPTSDGGAILFAYDTYASTPVQVERVNSSGQRLWLSTMPSGLYNIARSPRFTGSDLYFELTYHGAIFSSGAPLPIEDGLLMKLAMSDGSIEWSSSVPYVFGHSPRLVLDSNGTDLLTFSSWGTFTLLSSGDATQVRKYAASDGALIVSKLEPCRVDQCVLYDAIIALDGTLRMVHDTSDYSSGSLFELTTMQNEFDKIFANGFN